MIEEAKRLAGFAGTNFDSFEFKVNKKTGDTVIILKEPKLEKSL